MGMATAEGVSHVIRDCLAPMRRRHSAVEGDILLEGEQVEDGATDAAQALEIPYRGRIDVDAADAVHAGDDGAELCSAPIEALRTAAEATEQVTMVVGAQGGGAIGEGEGGGHAAPPAAYAGRRMVPRLRRSAR